VLFLVGAAKLCGYPFWKAYAWIESPEQLAPRTDCEGQDGTRGRDDTPAGPDGLG
jgi:hypothetical protein